MTRNYEVVYIFDSALEEAQITETLETVHALLKTDDAPDPITDTNNWGKRTLAYPVAGHEVGNYVVVHFEADPTLLPEYERLLKLNAAVIRYLVVLNEGAKPVPEISARSDDDDSPRSAPKPDAVTEGAAK
jgi:small subunit ribosomal protein S6